MAARARPVQGACDESEGEGSDAVAGDDRPERTGRDSSALQVWGDDELRAAIPDGEDDGGDEDDDEVAVAETLHGSSLVGAISMYHVPPDACHPQLSEEHRPRL